MPDNSQRFSTGRAILEYLNAAADSGDPALHRLPDILPPFAIMESQALQRPALVYTCRVDAQPQDAAWQSLDIPFCAADRGTACIDLYSPSAEWPAYSLLRIPVPADARIAELLHREGSSRFWLLLEDGTARTLNPSIALHPVAVEMRESPLDPARAQQAFWQLSRPARAPLEMIDGIRLWWNDKSGIYAGVMATPSDCIDLSLDPEDAQDISPLASSLRLWLQEMPRQLDCARRFAADSLREVWNEHWADPDLDEPLTHSEFMDQLSFKSLHLDVDGQFDIGFCNASRDSVSVKQDRQGQCIEATLG